MLWWRARAERRIGNCTVRPGTTRSALVPGRPTLVGRIAQRSSQVEAAGPGVTDADPGNDGRNEERSDAPPHGATSTPRRRRLQRFRRGATQPRPPNPWHRFTNDVRRGHCSITDGASWRRNLPGRLIDRPTSGRTATDTTARTSGKEACREGRFPRCRPSCSEPVQLSVEPSCALPGKDIQATWHSIRPLTYLPDRYSARPEPAPVASLRPCCSRRGLGHPQRHRGQVAGQPRLLGRSRPPAGTTPAAGPRHRAGLHDTDPQHVPCAGPYRPRIPAGADGIRAFSYCGTGVSPDTATPARRKSSRVDAVVSGATPTE